MTQRVTETRELIQESERLIAHLQVQQHYNQALIQQLREELLAAQKFLRSI